MAGTDSTTDDRHGRFRVMQESSSLPFGTSPEVWETIPQEQRTQLMQMEMVQAEARHQAHRSEIAFADQQAWSAAHSTIKLLMALNAGAIVAILAFLGSMIQAKASLFVAPLIFSLCAFLLGATSSVFASAVAYLAGARLTEALAEDVLTVRHPYVLGTDKSDGLFLSYNRLRNVGLGACIASGLCAMAGSGAFLNFAVVALKP